MKKTLLALIAGFAIIFCSAQKAEAQVCNPYWPYTGIGTLTCMDGVYFGWLYNGWANGEGYYYFWDGTVFHGNFSAGRPHGQGEVMCSMGYIAGIWNNGNFVQTIQVPQYQMQQNYQQAQYNYNTTPAVQNTYRQTTNDNFALSDYRIEDVSDTQFGKQLMGKMK